MMPTTCATCRFVKIYPGDKERWWAWACQCAPLPEWTNPVSGLTVADPPFQLCKKINFGDCQGWQEGPTPIHPKEPDHGV
jgi:hypothetical protein